MQKSFDPFGPIAFDGAVVTRPETSLEALNTDWSHTPFAATYEAMSFDDGEVDDDWSQFVNELHDEELDEGIAQLMRYAEEVDELARDGLSEHEFGAGGSAQVRQEFELIIGEVEGFLAGLSGELGTLEADSMSEAEIEAFVDSYRPEFEQGIGGWLRRKVRGAAGKVRGAAKKVIDGARKVAKGVRKKAKSIVGKVARGARAAGRKVARGVRATAGYAKGALRGVAKWAKKLGLGPLLKLIISRVKEHVGPFIRLALCAAMDKVPKSLRRHAGRLKGQVEKWLEKREVDAGLLEERDTAFDTVTIDPSDLQNDLDRRLAHLVLGEVQNESEWEASAAAYARLPESAGSDQAVETLNRARETFVQRITDAEVEDYGPEVDEFIGAVWPVLKGAVVVGGRKRIVGFISRKLVSPLIAKLFAKGGKAGRKLGKTVADPLGSVITSSGLSLLGLEVSVDDELDAAGQMVAATVEDTLRRVAAAPDHMLDDDALMEGFALEAFEAAAAANLPEILPEQVYETRPELREARRHKGCWITLPLKSRRRKGRALYRKYNATPEVEIDGEMARRLRTSCGRPLALTLRKRLGRKARGGLRARVHLYEAMPGTTDARLRANEVMQGDAEDDFELHPLTPDSAALLIGEPRLGRRVGRRSRCHRRRMGVGQRFYRLELLDEPMTAALVTEDTELDLRSAETNVVFDFPRETISMSTFVDESEIAGIAERVGQGGMPGGALVRLRETYREGLARALSGDYPGHVRLVHGGLTLDQARGEAFRWLPGATIDALVETLSGWMDRSLAELLREDSPAVVRAAAAPVFGATFTTRVVRPEGLAALHRAWSGQPVPIYSLLLMPGCSLASARVQPGFYRD